MEAWHNMGYSSCANSGEMTVAIIEIKEVFPKMSNLSEVIYEMSDLKTRTFLVCRLISVLFNFLIFQ